MNFVAFFASPLLDVVSQNIIAALLYDIAAEPSTDINPEAIEEIFYESITEGAQNILKSEQTKRRILDSLQLKELEPAFEKLFLHGQPLDRQYFVKRFSAVISKKNAKKIAPLFLAHFRKKIAADDALSKRIVMKYRKYLENGKWQLNGDAMSELEMILTAPNGKHDAETEAAPREEILTDDFEVVYIKNNHSGQLTYWRQSEFVIPVRGLRNVENYLQKSPRLYITGIAGGGKSVLISAYINNLVANGDLDKDRVFYYRFMEVVSDYDSFIASLDSFLRANSEPAADDEFEETPETLLLQSDCFVVLDDFQHVRDDRLYDLVHRLWERLEEVDSFQGKFIVVSREQPKSISLSERVHFDYHGLSVSESNALLRDKWDLNLPKLVARSVAKKMLGNPLLMLLFRDWLASEHHTDTEMERLVEYMPKDIDRLRDYVMEHLYEAFERTDSRLNSILKGVSMFAMAEEEEFFEQNYEKVGGGNFQLLLEQLVEKFELIEYDDNVRRYKLPDALRQFYYDKLQSIQMKRILHNNAGLLYRRRHERLQDIVDAVEGARHFQKAEREEEAVRLLEPVMDLPKIDEIYVKQILQILADINFDLFDNEQSKIHVLYNRGKFYLQSGLFKEAEDDLLECEALGPAEQQKAPILYGLSQVARARQEIEQCQQLLEEALAIYEANGERLGIARVYNDLAEIHLQRDDLDSAFNMLEQAAIIFEQKDQDEGALRAYNHLGWIFKVRQDWDAAYDHYQKALDIYERIHDQTGIADSLQGMGEIREKVNELDDAIGLYYKELRLREKIGDWTGAAGAYQRIGAIYQRRQEWDNAMEFFQEALDIYERSDDLYGLASVYYHIGIVHQGRSEWETAMGYYQKAQELYERTESPREYGDTFVRMAMVYRAMEEYERALDMYDKALEIKEKLDDFVGIADTYERIGDIYRDQQQAQYAIEVYERSIMMRDEMNDLAGISQIYYKIATIHAAGKAWQEATKFYQKALDIFDQLDDVVGMAKTHRALGGIYQSQRTWQRAVEYYQTALTLFEQTRDLDGLAHVKYNLGTISHDSGDWEGALVNYRESLNLFGRNGDLYNYAQTLGNISSIEFERKDHTLAIGKQVEILLYFQENERKDLVERVLSNLVACHQELGPDTFQALLTNCLEKITRLGVRWGQHQILPADKAGEMINEIFYNANAQ